MHYCYSEWAPNDSNDQHRRPDQNGLPYRMAASSQASQAPMTCHRKPVAYSLPSSIASLRRWTIMDSRLLIYIHARSRAREDHLGSIEGTARSCGNATRAMTNGRGDVDDRLMLEPRRRTGTLERRSGFLDCWHHFYRTSQVGDAATSMHSMAKQELVHQSHVDSIEIPPT